MYFIVCKGLLIPFVGTALGSACVYFMKCEWMQSVRRILAGFAAGVMVAASIWSLLIPAIEQVQKTMGRLAFVPAVTGFCIGTILLLLLDRMMPQLCLDASLQGTEIGIKRTTMLVLAVVLHNIPEGMAVGVVYAGLLANQAHITATGALALSVGIAIQNFPEGAIISMPLYANGMPKRKACMQGILSGVVEPVAGALTILLSTLAVPLLPYLLSFAAGAMVYVVVEELIPEITKSPYNHVGTIAFMLGFSIMMTLDVAFG